MVDSQKELSQPLRFCQYLDLIDRDLEDIIDKTLVQNVYELDIKLADKVTNYGSSIYHMVGRGRTIRMG